MSLEEAGVGLATINALGIAILLGSVFILPSLIYLIFSFRGGGLRFWGEVITRNGLNSR